jgi:hypothetical protein
MRRRDVDVRDFYFLFPLVSGVDPLLSKILLFIMKNISPFLYAEHTTNTQHDKLPFEREKGRD